MLESPDFVDEVTFTFKFLTVELRIKLQFFHSIVYRMNFAPYQDESPEIERALSPPNPEGRIKSPNLRSPRASADLPSPSHFAGGGHGNTGFGPDLEGRNVSLGAFETSLPIRMDVEAMLAYLLLPPAGGVFLLLTEHKSDYVR